jgi:Flp pilus assembly protein TadB
MRKALTARSIAVISAFPAAAAFMLAIVLPSQFAALCWGVGILLLVTALTSAIVGFRAISSSSERS